MQLASVKRQTYPEAASRSRWIGQGPVQNWFVFGLHIYHSIFHPRSGSKLICFLPTCYSIPFRLMAGDDEWIWIQIQRGHSAQCEIKKHSIDTFLIYTYYRRIRFQIPNLKPWVIFSLFLPMFPTANAISERGFSAMSAAHSKQRSELGYAQVFAHLMIGFNGPNA